MSAEWITAIASMLTVIVAFFGLLVAKTQLGGLRETLRLNSLMAVLSIEEELAERKNKCDVISIDIKRLMSRDNFENNDITLLKESLEAAVENWLNALERLSFCIIKSYVPEKDWRTEYREYIADTIRSQKHFFEADTRYTNILRLHNKWRSE